MGVRVRALGQTPVPVISSHSHSLSLSNPRTLAALSPPGLEQRSIPDPIFWLQALPPTGQLSTYCTLSPACPLTRALHKLQLTHPLSTASSVPEQHLVTFSNAPLPFQDRPYRDLLSSCPPDPEKSSRNGSQASPRTP